METVRRPVAGRMSAHDTTLYVSLLVDALWIFRQCFHSLWLSIGWCPELRELGNPMARGGIETSRYA